MRSSPPAQGRPRGDQQSSAHVAESRARHRIPRPDLKVDLPVDGAKGGPLAGLGVDGRHLWNGRRHLAGVPGVGRLHDRHRRSLGGIRHQVVLDGQQAEHLHAGHQGHAHAQGRDCFQHDVHAPLGRVFDARTLRDRPLTPGQAGEGHCGGRLYRPEAMRARRGSHAGRHPGPPPAPHSLQKPQTRPNRPPRAARFAEGILMRRLMLCLACLALAQPALAQDKDSAAVEKAQDRAPATPIEQPQDKASGTANETPPAASAEKAPAASSEAVQVRKPTLSEQIAAHAKANNLPESLVRRVIVRESRYNPQARGAGGAMGLMQIKHATARGMGYRGTAAGLLDAETNLTYGVRYLAGAYRAAGGNANQAVAYYAKGYYHSRGRVVKASARTKPAVRQEAAATSPRGLARETNAGAARHGAQ